MTELKDPKTRSIGISRMSGLIAAATVTAGMEALSAFKAGITKEEEKDLRHFSRPWDKNSQWMHVGYDKDGNYEYVNYGYSDPYAYFKEPFKAAMAGEPIEKSFPEVILQIAEPFFTPEILATKIGEITFNKKLRGGGKIYYDNDDVDTKAEKMIAHVWQAFEPGTIGWGRRVIMGAMGKTSKWGDPYDVKNELLSGISGLRINKIDIRKQMPFKAREFLAKKQGIEDEKKLLAVYDDFNDLIQAGMRIGSKSKISKAEMMALLDNSGISKDDAYGLVYGNYQMFAKSKLQKKMNDKKFKPVSSGTSKSKGGSGK
jgi:hypothetical protein